MNILQDMHRIKRSRFKFIFVYKKNPYGTPLMKTRINENHWCKRVSGYFLMDSRHSDTVPLKRRFGRKIGY